MKGIETVTERIKKKDTALVKILRVKNLFIENKKSAKELLKSNGMKRKLKNDDWLYQYADIKFNVLMEYQGMSLIVEIQFLLRFMQEAKKQIHQFYEITRNSSFVNDLSSIMSIANDIQEQLYFLIHSADDNEDDMDQLATFLYTYLDDIDLAKFDQNGYNVWHYICKIGNVRMFDLLLSLTTKEDWKKYLNTPAKLPDKPLCFHIAVAERNIEMIKRLRQIAMSPEGGKYHGVLSMDCKNGYDRTPLVMALVIRSYHAMKALYDKNNPENRRYIYHMLNLVVNSEEEFDKENEKENANFLFFQKLLKTPGVDGNRLMIDILKANRAEYFIYLFSINQKLSVKLELKTIYYWTGFYLNWRVLEFMVNNGTPNFEFSALKIASRYYECLKDIVNSTNIVKEVNDEDDASILESPAYKCFVLMIETTQVINALKNEKAKSILSTLASAPIDAHLYIKKLLDTASGQGWDDMDFTLPYAKSGGINPLKHILYNSYHKSAILLFEHPKYSFAKCINDTQLDDKQRTPLLMVAASTKQYWDENSLESPNGKLFRYLLEKCEDVDINAKDKNGNGIIYWLHGTEKDSFINYIKAKSRKGDVSWKYDISSINNELKKWDTVNAIVTAANESDHKKLSKILRKINNVQSVINLHGTKDEIRSTAINMAITTSAGYDKDKPKDGDAFKTLELLLANGADPLVIGTNVNAIGACIKVDKAEFLKRIVEATEKKMGKENSIEVIDVLTNANHANAAYYDNSIEYTIRNCYVECCRYLIQRLKAKFETKKISDCGFDANELLYRCIDAEKGYNAKSESECDNFKLYEMLLEELKDDIDLNWKHRERPFYTLLMWMVIKGKFTYFTTLFEKHEKLCKTIDFSKHETPYGSNLLHLAALQGSLKFVEYMLNMKHKFDINNTLTRDGNSILLTICQSVTGFNLSNQLVCDNYVMFKKLIDIEDINFKHLNDDGEGCIESLIQKKKYKFIDVLLESEEYVKRFELKKEEIDKRIAQYKFADELGIAATASDYDKLKSLLESKQDCFDNITEVINLEGPETGRTALCACALSKTKFDEEAQLSCVNFKCFELLLEVPDIDPSIGINTCMTCCLFLNKNEYVRYLLEYKDKLGIKADFGKETNVYNSRNNLTYAVLATPPNVAGVEILVSSGQLDGTLNDISRDGHVVKILCDKHQWIYGYDKDLPFESECWKCLDICLRKNELDLNTKDDNGYSAFMAFIKYDKGEYLEKFVELYKNGTYSYSHFSLNDIVNHVNVYNEGCLFMCVKHGRFSILTFLLSLDIYKEFDINQVGGKYDNTLLNECARSMENYQWDRNSQCDNFFIFDFLLGFKGIDPYIKNKLGYNAFDICYNRDKRAHIARLQQWKQDNKK